MKLTSDVGFNIDLQGIHFANGRFNLFTGVFESDCRTKDSMINSCLSYDFVPSSADMEQLVNEYFQRSYKEPGVWEYMKSYIGSCMVGSVKDCEFLLNWGVGGSGKSTLLNILSDIFKDSYCYVGNSEMFNGETQMRMAIKGIPPSARFILIEEIDKVGVSSNAISYIKKLCDGKIDIRDARGHNITTYNINAKMILTSNFLVSLDDTDTGILRRFMTYEYKNRFVLSNSLGSSQIDNIKIFPQQSLLDLFRLKGYDCDYSVIKSCAFVVFAREAFAKLNGNSVPRPNQYVPSGLELPTWHKFVSTFLEKKTSSRVSKTTLQPLVIEFFKKEVSQKDFLFGIQSAGIEYDKDLRVEGNGDIRGAFVDVRLIETAPSATAVDDGLTWVKFVSTFLKKEKSSRVSKAALLPCAQDFFNKEVSLKELVPGVQSAGIIYEKTFRVEGSDIRGAFVDVKLVEIESSDADSTTGLTAAIDTIDIDCASTVSSELTDGTELYRLATVHL